MKTAQQWQEAYKVGDADVTALYAAPCFVWPNADRTNPLKSAAIEEWRMFLLGEGAEAEYLAPLELLHSPAARVVVTGQQAGAALGPLYTLHKALAARHWAAEFTKETGQPCVPVFWIASDDHDLAEVQVAAWLDASGNRRTADLHPEKTPANRPVYNVGIDAEAAESFAESFLASTTESEFRAGIVEAVRASLLDATFESSFLRLFCRFLLPLGIIPVVPRLGFIREAALPLLERELAAPGAASVLVREKGQQIVALGAEAPLHRRGDEINFFMDVDGVRAKMIVAGGMVGFVDPTSGSLLRESSLEDMCDLAQRSPGLFSPNAIMRPLVQDAALPSVAYIGGPSEVLYHAQLGPLYEAFKVPRPAVMPRPSVLLLEPKTVRAAAKLDMEPTTLARSSKADLEAAGAAVDPALTGYEAQAAALRGAAAELMEAIRSAERDTAVIKASEKVSSSMDSSLTILMDRLIDYYRRRDGDKVAARQKLVTAIFPDDEPQERSVGILSPLLVNYGQGVLSGLSSAIDYRAAGMQAICLADLRND